MCKKIFHHCSACGDFYPSNKHIRVRKEYCNSSRCIVSATNDSSNTGDTNNTSKSGSRMPCSTQTRYLLDTRHASCCRKWDWFGLRCRTRENILIPMDIQTAARVERIEARRRRRRMEVPGLEDVGETILNKENDDSAIGHSIQHNEGREGASIDVPDKDRADCWSKKMEGDWRPVPYLRRDSPYADMGNPFADEM